LARNPYRSYRLVQVDFTPVRATALYLQWIQNIRTGRTGKTHFFSLESVHRDFQVIYTACYGVAIWQISIGGDRGKETLLNLPGYQIPGT
jgi:hypothetical protein